STGQGRIRELGTLGNLYRCDRTTNVRHGDKFGIRGYQWFEYPGASGLRRGCGSEQRPEDVCAVVQSGGVRDAREGDIWNLRAEQLPRPGHQQLGHDPHQENSIAREAQYASARGGVQCLQSYAVQRDQYGGAIWRRGQTDQSPIRSSHRREPNADYSVTRRARFHNYIR